MINQTVNTAVIPRTEALSFLDAAIKYLESQGRRIVRIDQFYKFMTGAQWDVDEISTNVSDEVVFLVPEMFMGAQGTLGEITLKLNPKNNLDQQADVIYGASAVSDTTFLNLVLNNLIATSLQGATTGLGSNMKLALGTSDVISGDGDKEKLLDEQATAGDPRGGAGGNLFASSKWNPGASTSDRHAIIDLGAALTGVEVWYYKNFGTVGVDQIEFFSSLDDITYTSEGVYETDGQGWVGANVFTSNGGVARYVKIQCLNNGAFVPCAVNELVFYGATQGTGGNASYNASGYRVELEG